MEGRRLLAPGAPPPNMSMPDAAREPDGRGGSPPKADCEGRRPEADWRRLLGWAPERWGGIAPEPPIMPGGAMEALPFDGRRLPIAMGLFEPRALPEDEGRRKFLVAIPICVLV
jgi:hypothetical protein